MVALIKRILFFLASIVFTIVLLIGATTSDAKDEYDAATMESNYRFYTIDWIDEVNEHNKKYVCGTKVSTFDTSGRKYHLEYYIILMNNDSLVTRFEVKALQISFEEIEPIKTEDLPIRLYASKIIKDGKNILGGPRGENSKYKGIAIEFSESDYDEDVQIFKTLYKGGYDIEVFVFPSNGTKIPITSNIKYTKDSEKILDNCLKELMHNYKEAQKPKGEVFAEEVKSIG